MTRRKFIVGLVVVACFCLMPVCNNMIDMWASGRLYVTTLGAKYCYYTGHQNKNIKMLNQIHYATLAACGKKLKVI